MKNPAEETYADIEKLIYYVANKWVARFGGDIEEVVAEANIAYMKAYNHWQPGHGSKFSHYVTTCVWRRLMVLQRKERRSRHVWDHNLTDRESEVVDRSPVANRIAELVEDLSADAAMVVNLVIDAPQDLVDELGEKRNRAYPWACAIRRRLREMGWNRNRIASVFEEVGTALV